MNYNRKDLLERFLPSLIKSARASRFPCYVTVLDNGSTDGSVSYVREHFPEEVEVMVAPENKVLCSYNDAVQHIAEDIVILINNDMETEEGFVDPLLEVFLGKSDAFFVATHGDCSIARSHWGVITADITYPGAGAFVAQPGYAFSAGVGAFDRKKFIELNGYDEIYLPALYEDVDLCFRGWKRGWKGYYQPASRKSHIGSASMSKRYKPQELQKIAFRNGILFMVKNISDPFLLTQFVLFLFIRLLGAMILNKWFLVQGFIESLGRIPKALELRKYNAKNVPFNDRKLFEFINDGRKQKTHIQMMKRCVNYLGAAHYLRKPAFFLAFFTLRFIFPLQFFLLRELIDCKSILDLGCGNHSMVPSVIPDNVYTVGVERFKPSYEEAVREGRHKKYIFSDVMEVDFAEKSFDAVVLLDVLEHLTKEDGEKLLGRIERWAKKKVLVFTPNGFVPQEAYENNPFMEHKSGWCVGEFKSRGYQLFGVRGFRFLTNIHLHEDRKLPCLVHMSNMAQILTYHFPNIAFQLFCKKELLSQNHR